MAVSPPAYTLDDAWYDDAFTDWMHDVMGENMNTMFSGDILLAYSAYRFGKQQANPS